MAATHGRRQLRLRKWDYARTGSYFITISTINGADLLGRIVGTKMQLNAFGEIATESWRWLALQYEYVTLDEWTIMPTHLHGILTLTTRGAPVETHGSGISGSSRRKPVGQLVGAFKTRSTKKVNRVRETPGALLWQRNFWERVIRDEYELSRIREYIRRNPERYAPRTYTV
jgi:REP element-mobilizing transposase RayT